MNSGQKTSQLMNNNREENLELKFFAEYRHLG